MSLLRRKILYILSGISIIGYMLISIFGFVNRLFYKPPNSPYYNEWVFFLCLFLIMSFAGCSLLKPTRKLISISLVLVGIVVGFFTCIILMWLPTGGQEGLLYVLIASAPLPFLIIIISALKMRRKDIESWGIRQ